ncbi:MULTISPECIES: hypothetical protein [Halorussus]|uniref:hypothetical protein n=1 Tax=Halorussus TaxID=1070314 RepID=UPI0020A2002F|nr:hypothetical protein [Halorussus vallis]USZ77772.1 hypothetical protein NGM07_21560 [Halorussus vallis]
MIKFDLENEWDGWSGIGIPDDLTVKIRTASESHVLETSLMGLFELYGYVLHEEPGELLVGTGSTIRIIGDDSGVIFEANRLSVQTTFGELRENLKQLLREVFAAKDVREGPDEREDAIRYAEKQVHDKGIGYDVGVLYEQLTS